MCVKFLVVGLMGNFEGCFIFFLNGFVLICMCLGCLIVSVFFIWYVFWFVVGLLIF